MVRWLAGEGIPLLQARPGEGGLTQILKESQQRGPSTLPPGTGTVLPRSCPFALIFPHCWQNSLCSFQQRDALVHNLASGTTEGTLPGVMLPSHFSSLLMQSQFLGRSCP